LEKGLQAANPFFSQLSNEQLPLPMTISNTLIARVAKKILERWSTYFPQLILSRITL